MRNFDCVFCWGVWGDYFGWCVFYFVVFVGW